MIGTGPFRFVRFARGDRVELARNDDYWGAQGGKSAAWEKVTFRIVPTDPARLAGLLSGDLDAIDQVPTADLPRIRRDARLQTAQRFRGARFSSISISSTTSARARRQGRQPLARNPFRDLRVRRALSRPSTGRRSQSASWTGRRCRPRTCLAARVRIRARPEARAPRSRRGEEAARRAGYPDGFAMTLSATNNRYVNDEQIAQAVAQMLARVASARASSVPDQCLSAESTQARIRLRHARLGLVLGRPRVAHTRCDSEPRKRIRAWNWSGYSNRRWTSCWSEASPASTKSAARRSLARRCGLPCGITP